MTILALPAADVQIIDAEPTALDREHAAASSPFASEALQSDEPTPDDALACTLDADEDLGDWWAWMPADEDLDSRWTATIAGGRASASRRDADEDSERFD